jgi:uncharacterized RDD family membrane protein YckC
MADGTWHYVINGQQQNPVAWDALLALAQSGTLAPTDLVWTDGMPQWQPAGTVAGSFAQIPAPAGAQAINYATPVAMGLNYYNPNVSPVQYAGFWIRFWAWFIDALIQGVPMWVVYRMVNYGLSGTWADAKAFTVAFFINQTLSILVYWLYSALQQSSPTQATLGMQVAGLHVTDMHGQRVTFARATGRFFGSYLSSLTLGIGFIMIAFTQRSQALHDMMAGTVVTYKTPGR